MSLCFHLILDMRMTAVGKKTLSNSDLMKTEKTLLGKNKAKVNRVLPRELTGHSKHPLPTTQEKTRHMDITRWSTPKSD